MHQQSVVDELALQQQLFRERLKEFCCCYDLHGSGLKYREEEDKKRLGILNDDSVQSSAHTVQFISPYAQVSVVVLPSSQTSSSSTRPSPHTARLMVMSGERSSGGRVSSSVSGINSGSRPSTMWVQGIRIFS